MSKATVKTTPAQKVLLVLGSGLLMLVGVSRATRRPRDHNGQQLAYIYFEGEPGRRSAAKRLTKGRGAADRGEYRQAAGVVAEGVPRERPHDGEKSKGCEARCGETGEVPVRRR